MFKSVKELLDMCKIHYRIHRDHPDYEKCSMSCCDDAFKRIVGFKCSLCGDTFSIGLSALKVDPDCDTFLSIEDRKKIESQLNIFIAESIKSETCNDTQ
jgi:hypothetical protein